MNGEHWKTVKEQAKRVVKWEKSGEIKSKNLKIKNEPKSENRMETFHGK